MLRASFGCYCQRGQRLPLRFSLLQICPSDLVRTRTREHATIPAVALPSARLNQLQILAVTVTAVNNAGGMPVLCVTRVLASLCRSRKGTLRGLWGEGAAKGGEAAQRGQVKSMVERNLREFHRSECLSFSG